MNGDKILAFYLVQVGLHTTASSEEWDQWTNNVTGGDPSEESDTWDEWDEWDQHIEEVDPNEEPEVWNPDNW